VTRSSRHQTSREFAIDNESGRLKGLPFLVLRRKVRALIILNVNRELKSARAIYL
jgi:hypothetical protein